MSVNYNDFAKTFANSRKTMKWEEIEYFLTFLEWKKDLRILDVWCWSWRLLNELKKSNLEVSDYLGVDLSKWLLDVAQKNNPDNKFIELNMLDLDKIKWKFNVIFFVASFHHINTIEDRIRIIKKAYKKIESWGMIFFTNWALESELNKKRYLKSKVKWSRNQFWSCDFNIKLWEFTRYYHSFHLDELRYLFEKVWFNILESREFSNKRNFISIIKKVWD